MTVNRTTLLDLPLPVTGTESGTWGDTTNNGLTQYLDIAIAGSLVLSADSDTTLSSTEGDSSATNIGGTTAQYAVLRCTGARTTTRNINAPAWTISGGTISNYSKTYVVINDTTGGQSIVLRATNSATPTYTTGVTIVAGERAVCAWNGSDFVKVGGAAGGTNTQVQYNNNGVFGGSADLTWDGSTLATTGLTASGAVTLSATTQNIALGTSQVGGTWTAGGASQTGAITLDQSTKTHTLNIGTGATENALTKTINLGTAGVSGSTTAINIGSAVSGATTNVTLNGTVQPGVVISGSSSGDALRITQTGAGNALLVEDSANPDSSPFVVTAAGDVGIGTSSPKEKLDSRGAAVFSGDNATGTNAFGTSAGILLSTASDGSNARITAVSNGNNNVGLLLRALNAGSAASSTLLLDSSGNLGLGVTPSGWGNSYKVFEVGSSGSGIAVPPSNGNINVLANAYNNNTNWIYGSSSYAGRYTIQASTGTHAWFTAPSGTANTAVVAASTSYTVVALGTTTLAQWQASFSGLSAIPTLGQVLTSLASPVSPIPNGGLVSQNITFTQAMTLDASGNLLVGKTSGSYRFDLQGAAGENATLAGFFSGTNTSRGLTIGLSAGGGAANDAYVVYNSTITGGYAGHIWQAAGTERARITSGGDFFIGNGETAASPSAGILSATGGTGTNIAGANLTIRGGASTGSGAGGAIIFSTAAAGASGTTVRSASERGRFTTQGYFKASDNGAYENSASNFHEIRNTTSNETLYMTNTNGSPYGLVVYFTGASPNAGGNEFVYCRDSTAVRATIRSNGGIANYSANDVNLSDRREKTNFAPAKSYLDTICAIPVQTFNYIDQSEDDPGLTLGVVAQDVQAVAPELVMESNWGTEDNPKMRLSIYQTDLQYALMKCIQEQQALITSLTARVAALEGTQP